MSSTMDRFQLGGRTALVTGASRGIGRGIALGLAEAGADVVLASRTVEDLETVATEVQQLGQRSAVVPCDMSMLDEVQGLAQRAESAMGPLDILVNVAGFNRRMPAIEMGVADWDDVVNVNLRSVFFLSQAVARRWIQAERFTSSSDAPKGKIISIGSLAGGIGFVGQAQYAAAKAGLVGMTRVLSSEWAPHGICVNVIAPGYIDTALTAPIWQDPARSQRVLGRTPAGRPGQVSEIVGAAIFLAASASDFVSGQALYVDGGFQAG